MPVVWQWQRDRGSRGRVSRGGIAPEENGGSPGERSGPTAAAPGGDSEREGPLSDPAFVAGLRPIPSRPTAGAGGRDLEARWSAADIVGVTPAGAPIEIRVGRSDRPLLVAFLATRCDGCAEFWQGFGGEGGGGLPASVSAVVVTRGPDFVAPEEVARVAGAVVGAPVVMSDQAWGDYRVLGYPFFVLVDPASGTVIGETVGFGWSDVRSMIRSAGQES